MKIKLLPILASLLWLSNGAEAASLGTYRVYLDTEKRSQKFPVRNRSNFDEECSVDFKYRAYEGKGNKFLKGLSDAEENTLVDEFLQKVRYSPKNFVLKANSTQFIAFNSRRRVNDVDAEYRVYPAIKCQKVGNKNVTNGFTTALELIVPFVIRTGNIDNLSAELSLSDAKQDGEIVTFRLNHEGNRSVYGHVDLVDEDGDVVKVIERNTVIYPDMAYRDYSFSLPKGKSKEDYSIYFKELDELKNKIDVIFAL